ncbi:sigma-70 family RNA polymerase sigma factor [Clostridium bovifaecis]|uniref:Sigma-70 family RNA polymerase sigma factor n=1 Tax=Clostridium bovifaecis TaxID=2184719 RepID=A0A6I6ET93_9CLOT|nr:sigma-70 family RNA polymerase sigma factor [Clostridium bovifaecis]
MRSKSKCLEKYIMQNKESHYRVAYSYVKNKEDALDIVQDSIYKAFKSISVLENTDNINSWFYRILINTAIDYIRKNSKISLVEDFILDSNDDSKEDNYEDIDLQKALDNLPEINKTVITLRYFEDLRLEDIADILGENLSTVKTRLYTGLRKLRIEMEE